MYVLELCITGCHYSTLILMNDIVLINLLLHIIHDSSVIMGFDILLCNTDEPTMDVR